jgi:hypothetical protein
MLIIRMGLEEVTGGLGERMVRRLGGGNRDGGRLDRLIDGGRGIGSQHKALRWMMIDCVGLRFVIEILYVNDPFLLRLPNHFILQTIVI